MSSYEKQTVFLAFWLHDLEKSVLRNTCMNMKKEAIWALFEIDRAAFSAICQNTIYPPGHTVQPRQTRFYLPEETHSIHAGLCLLIDHYERVMLNSADAGPLSAALRVHHDLLTEAAQLWAEAAGLKGAAECAKATLHLAPTSAEVRQVRTKGRLNHCLEALVLDHLLALRETVLAAHGLNPDSRMFQRLKALVGLHHSLQLHLTSLIETS